MREPTDVAAQIVLPASEVKCRVVDFSKSGAGLAVTSAFGVPNTFELRAGGRTYQTAVMRRSPGHLGVRLL